MESPEGSPRVHTGNVWKGRDINGFLLYKTPGKCHLGYWKEKSKKAVDCDRVREEKQSSGLLLGWWTDLNRELSH